MGTKMGSLRALAFMMAVALMTVAVGCQWSATDDAPTQTYIVGLRGAGQTDVVANEREERGRARVEDRLYRSMQGFVATMSESEAQDLARDARVAFVEPDREIRVAAQTTPTGINRIGATANANLRINGSADGDVDVDVAVVDSGIDLDNPDLNVVEGVDCQSTCRAGGDDDNRHGTHVAGTIGARDDGNGVVGVAPGARLWAVKVLDSGGSGSVSSIVRGLEWVAANSATIEVVNMSLGGAGTSSALTNAVNNLIARGVVVVVAAGNDARNASTTSPANVPDAITVSAVADYNGAPGGGAAATCSNVGTDDRLATFSNFGTVIDIAAPGGCILSTVPGGSFAQLSGTSMATPHVTGAAALLASRTKPLNRTDVLAVAQTLKANGTTDWTDTSSDGVKEPLLAVANPSAFNAKLVGVTPPSTTTTTTTRPTTTTTRPTTTTTRATTTTAPTTTPSTTTPSTTAPTTTPSTTAPSTTTTVPSTGITLSGQSMLFLGFLRIAALQWSGAPGARMQVYRGNTAVGTSTSSSYMDLSGWGPGTQTFRVCRAGTTSCSNTITATF